MSITPDFGPWPYIRNGDLVIPSECDTRWKFWRWDWGKKYGMSLADVCRTIGAPECVVEKYVCVEKMPSRGTVVDIQAALDCERVATGKNEGKRNTKGQERLI